MVFCIFSCSDPPVPSVSRYLTASTEGVPLTHALWWLRVSPPQGPGSFQVVPVGHVCSSPWHFTHMLTALLKPRRQPPVLSLSKEGVPGPPPEGLPPPCPLAWSAWARAGTPATAPTPSGGSPRALRTEGFPSSSGGRSGPSGHQAVCPIFTAPGAGHMSPHRRQSVSFTGSCFKALLLPPL